MRNALGIFVINGLVVIALLVVAGQLNFASAQEDKAVELALKLAKGGAAGNEQLGETAIDVTIDAVGLGFPPAGAAMKTIKGLMFGAQARHLANDPSSAKPHGGRRTRHPYA